tara:strand:+ start:680 stop:823 length:144 start_codon:yes stop_codon:yes gene_type:complete
MQTEMERGVPAEQTVRAAARAVFMAGAIEADKFLPEPAQYALFGVTA